MEIKGMMAAEDSSVVVVVVATILELVIFCFY